VGVQQWFFLDRALGLIQNAWFPSLLILDDNGYFGSPPRQRDEKVGISSLHGQMIVAYFSLYTNMRISTQAGH
jgi:hypothetical protein